MVAEKLLTNTNNEEKNVDKLFKNLEILSELNECEYIYIDTIDMINIANPLFKNKTIVTKKINNYFMLENNDINNLQMTELNYRHIVDLLILNNDKNKITDDINELIDQDTIIIKNLGNNVIYIEDKRKEMKILITEYEKIVINSEGIKTQLQYYEMLN